MVQLPVFIKKILENKLVRFFLVSGLNTVFGYGVYALLLFVKVPYPLALLTSTIVGVLFNFKTIGVIVFRNGNNKLIFKFFCVYGITYLFNLGGITLLKQIDVDTYLGGLIMLVPTGLLSFLLNKLVVFKSGSKIKTKA